MGENLNNPDCLDAIREGVKDAIIHLFYQASDMPGTDLFEMVKQGVEQGIKEMHNGNC